MEAMGEWSTGLGGMYTEESDFMNQLLASYDQPCGGSSSETTVTTTSYHRQNSHWTGGYCFSQESSSYSAGHSSYFAVMPPQEETNVNDNGMEDVTINTNLYLVGEETSTECDVTDQYSGRSFLPLETVEESHHHTLLQPDISLTTTTDEKLLNRSESSKKRMRTTQTEKNKRASKTRRSQRSLEMSGDNDNSCEEEQTEKAKGKRKTKQVKLQKNCCSDDKSNGGQTSFSKEGADDDSKALNLNGKTRASQGAATDPQSLYARKRRERINERLRILQNLVPNGRKVDISTMLEEAVQYVKFLQLQIKLLSSDDLWMFAPIAYNGMDIGLDQKLNELIR